MIPLYLVQCFLPSSFSTRRNGLFKIVATRKAIPSAPYAIPVIRSHEIFFSFMIATYCCAISSSRSGELIIERRFMYIGDRVLLFNLNSPNFTMSCLNNVSAVFSIDPYCILLKWFLASENALDPVALLSG